MLLRKFLSIFLLLILLVSQRSWAFDVPELREPVQDEVGIIDSQDRQFLQQLIAELNKQEVQLQVLVLKSLSGEPIESATIKIFDKWELGQKKSNKGVLFLVATDDKKMRIEVGRGLEGDIPDVIAKRILSDQVAPVFRSGRYSFGIVVGSIAIAKRTGVNLEGLSGASPGWSAPTTKLQIPDFWLFVIFFVVVVILNLMKSGLGVPRRGYRSFPNQSSGWGGGSGGWSRGGGWSGGGGSSAGGGASSDW